MGQANARDDIIRLLLGLYFNDDTIRDLSAEVRRKDTDNGGAVREWNYIDSDSLDTDICK
jgi:hypothetical protein